MKKFVAVAEWVSRRPSPQWRDISLQARACRMRKKSVVGNNPLFVCSDLRPRNDDLQVDIAKLVNEWIVMFSLCLFIWSCSFCCCLKGGYSIAAYVLLTELVGIRHRSTAGCSIWYSFNLSNMALAGLAYLVKDWRMLSIIMGAPAIPFLLGWLYVFWNCCCCRK